MTEEAHRLRPSRTLERVQDFWTWWAHEGAARTAAALRSADPAAGLAELEARVGAIAPGLTGHVARGAEGGPALLHLGWHGDPMLRGTAERWRLLGPRPDDHWTYLPSRPPDPAALDKPLQLDDVTLDPARMRVSFAVNQAQYLVDFTVHHPGFAGLAPDVARGAAGLVLGWALGEDDVARWAGSLTASAEASDGGLAPGGLPSLVAELEDDLPEDEVDLRGELAGAAAFAVVRRPLKWIDHVLADQHLTVALAYQAEPDGLPGEAAVQRLRALQEDLMSRLDEMAMVVARMISNGWCSLHLYSDSWNPAVEERVRRWAAGVPEAQVESAFDPGWSDMAVFA